VGHGRQMKPEFPESLPDFQRLFPDEAHCAAYMENLRWPDGFSLLGIASHVEGPTYEGLYKGEYQHPHEAVR
jgi:hypothetical protein